MSSEVRSRGFRIANAVVAMLALLLVMSLVVLALASSYPDVMSKMGAEFVGGQPLLGDALERVDSVAQSLGERARQGFEYRVSGPLRHVFKGGNQTTREPMSSVAVSTFPISQCRRCHPDFETRPLFGVVYSPHDTHACEGIPCSRCHAAVGPRRDVAPLMSGCSRCHAQTRDGSGQCGVCHPPGSLFHGARYSGSRAIGQRCVVCHPPAALQGNARRHIGMPVLGSDIVTCSSCHRDAFCGRCHPPSHGSAIARSHPAQLRSRSLVQLECYGCHDPSWCAERCHASTARRERR